MKKRQLAETEKEMNELGYALGLENGDGKWEMADRLLTAPKPSWI